MTDPVTSPPDAKAAPAKSPRWVKVLLALSLALNVAVLGIVAGAALKFHRGGVAMDGPGGMSFGPFSDALTQDQRRALFRDLSKDGSGLRDMRRELRADMDRVLTTLRATPFDPQAFRSAIEQQNNRLAARVDQGREGLIDLIEAMTDAERADFAAKLERRLRDRKPRN